MRPAADKAALTESPLLTLQRTVGNQAVSRAFKSGLIQPKLRVSQPGDSDEQAADRAAAAVTRRSESLVHRKCGCGGTCPTCRQEEEPEIHRRALGPLSASPLALQRAVAPTNGARAEKPSAAEAGQTTSRRFIVEDDVPLLGPGQLHRTQFLQQLRGNVIEAAEATLSTVGRSTASCPYLRHWLDFYAAQDSQYLERAIHKYAPDALRARSAADYLSIIRSRVVRAVSVWIASGKVTGVPPDLPLAGPEVGTKVAGNEIRGVGPETSGSAVLLKPRGEGTSALTDVQAVQDRLGSGRSLDSAVQSRMESAFGESFSGVRVHTDSNAAGLCSELDARAFTLGRNVAFAANEYRPGTAPGDALIAHELAHVIQQRSGGHSPSPMRKGNDYDSLERDADTSAVGAVVSLWSGLKEFASGMGQSALPRLKSGLRLQRCSGCEPDKQKQVEEAGAPTETKPDAGGKTDAGTTGPVSPPACTPSSGKCASTQNPDTVVCDHTVTPDVIEKPGDTVDISVKFACEVKGGRSIIQDTAGTSLGSPTKDFTSGSTFTRDWDGKKLFGSGASTLRRYLVDDGEYRHRLENVKYGYRYNPATKKSDDLFATGPNLISKPIKVKARQFKGTGTDHFHYTPANADRLADILESEVSPSIANDAELKAVAWAVRNQMIRLSTGTVEDARKVFKDSVAHPAPATGKSKTIAEEVLKKPMSDDVTSGAINWYSPRSMPKKGESCAGKDCRGGLFTETDLAGTVHQVYGPSFRKTMNEATVPGVRPWILRLYKL